MRAGVRARMPVCGRGFGIAHQSLIYSPSVANPSKTTRQERRTVNVSTRYGCESLLSSNSYNNLN